MEITGKLKQIGNATEGTSQRGPWRKATVVFETQEQYPKTIAVDFFNSKLDEVTRFPLGAVLKVQFDISSREFNGKWYTNCSGFGIETAGESQNNDFDKPIPPLSQPDEEQDDLPY